MDQWGERDDDEREAYKLLTPAFTAFMQRVDGLGQTESMWIHCYPELRLMVETLPPVKIAVSGHAVGIVREIPVGRAAVMADRLAGRVTLHAMSGWLSRPAAVWSGDPWTVTSVLDGEATF
jgi:hypothetical protein